ncbi:MAG TPA: hypothetical protein VGD17_08800 [Chitinophagaceae bacterium]
MSIFHFPRINVKGLFTINVGTANNDDYSGYQFPPGGPNAGQPVRLFDSINVLPLTYGMTDDEWTKWAITPITVSDPSQVELNISKAEGATSNTQVLPGEWNFFGDMGLTMNNVTVTGVTDPQNVIPAALKQQITQGVLSFNNRPDATGRSTGVITDINAEDVNSSQFFADYLSLASGGSFLFSGKPTKGMIRWINFQRNNNLTGSNGAAGTFQMCVPIDQLQGQPILEAFPSSSPEGLPLAGLVFRYTIFRGLQEISVFKYPNQQDWLQQMVQLYASKGLNPHNEELQGTVAPWYAGEPSSCPAGRLLLPTSKTIPVPPGCKGNGPQFSLCPAVIYINWSANIVSLDLSASLPDQYSGNYDPYATGNNPKWDFGPIALAVIVNGNYTKVGDIDYTPTAQNDATGWVFDFPFDPSIKNLLLTGDFVITSLTYGDLLLESTYFILSDQSGVYTEMGPATTTVSQFRNDSADLVPISFNVYKKGQLLTASDPERLTLYWYDTTPNQASPTMPANLLQNNYVPGSPISFSVDAPGNRLITAVLSTNTQAMPAYGNFDNVRMPMITMRILPYNDYSMYYIDPTAPQPVGNDQLTFDVIYKEVLQTYYLLYPAMNERIALNDPDEWSDAEMAGRLMQRIGLDFWGTALQMPRTKDLSQSRRDLLTAWCLKFFQNT